MSTKELQKRVAELESENSQLKSDLASALKLAEDAKSAAPVQEKSKSRVQAEQAFALLQKGPVTIADLKGINEKYPSDPIYFVRTILKQTVVTAKAKEGKTTYSLPGAAPATEEVKKEVAPATAPETPAVA